MKICINTYKMYSKTDRDLRRKEKKRGVILLIHFMSHKDGQCHFSFSQKEMAFESIVHLFEWPFSHFSCLRLPSSNYCQFPRHPSSHQEMPSSVYSVLYFAVQCIFNIILLNMGKWKIVFIHFHIGYLQVN